MEKKSSFFKSNGFGLLALWFGAGIGASFATGAMFTSYFTRHGWTAIFCLPITWFLAGTAAYYAVEFSRLIGANNYRDYALNFYTPNNKVLSRLFLLYYDVLIILQYVIGLAGMLAAGGSLFNAAFNPSPPIYWLGVLFVAVASVLLVLFGAKPLLRYSKFLAFGLCGTIIIIGITILFTNFSEATSVIANRTMTEGSTIWAALWSAVQQASFNIYAVPMLLATAPLLESRKDTRVGTWGAAIAICSVGLILIIALLAYYPGNLTSSIPILEALEDIGGKGLVYVYQLMLLLALITSNAASVFALDARIGPLLQKHLKIKQRLATAIVTIGFQVIAVVLSRFGVLAIFVKGYGLTSKLAMPVIILPMLILGPIRVAQMRKKKQAEAEKEEKAVV